MEKTWIILSVLLHSDEVMYFFWGVLGLLNMSSGSYLIKAKRVTEKELEKISPDHKHIKYDFTVYGVYITTLTFILTWIMVSSFNGWAMENYGRKFYSSFVFCLSAFGIFIALFAISKGIYPIVQPMRRMLYFIFEDFQIIRRAAIIHIIISIAIFGFSVLTFFATV